MPLPTPCRVQGFALFLLATAIAHGQSDTNSVFAMRAEQAFAHAQREFATRPDEATNAWHLGQAAYDWAEFATNSDQRAAVAQAGIAACRHLLARDPKAAWGHYYLGMDYGELAEAEAPSMAAYKLIREIEHEFKSAADLDEGLDFAGPLRCLGVLYRDAPGWPISIGSTRKAREYLEGAAAVAPNYPGNQLNLVESYIQWHQPAEAQMAWHKLARLWPAAQTNLSGMAWEASWAEWAGRRTAAKADFRKIFKQTLEP